MRTSFWDVRSIPAVGWAAFLILAVAGVMIAIGAPSSPIMIIAILIAVLFAYRYPVATYGVLVALVPAAGVTVSVSTGALEFGERAFGGSIDVHVVEVVAMVLMVAWAVKIIWLWGQRHDVNWRPWFPLALPMAALVGAHLVSAFSPFQPDTLLVVKYALRPVLWAYLVYVALTVNMVQSPRTLRTVLGVVAGTGIATAVMGLISLAIPDASGGLFPRARPLPFLGVMPLGDNHNQLGEWLCVTIPVTLALLFLSPAPTAPSDRVHAHRQFRLFLLVAIGVQILAALLTFARTVWIVLLVEAALGAWLVWRREVTRWIRGLLVGLVFLLPVAVAMFAFSATPLVEGSTSTRLMMSEIAFTLWSASPMIGMGAGTFVERIGATHLFLFEYGAPLESHGIVQKLLAETGLVGFAAMGWIVWRIVQYVWIVRRRMRGRVHAGHLPAAVADAFTILAISAAGAFAYQLFSTSYWTGKLWLPVGILFAAGHVFGAGRRDAKDHG